MNFGLRWSVMVELDEIMKNVDEDQESSHLEELKQRRQFRQIRNSQVNP